MEILTVNIFGQSYKIRTDASEEYVKRIVDYINNKMEKISQDNPSMPSSKIVVLTILEIADELFQLKEKNPDNNILGEKTKDLINKIEKRLSNFNDIINENTDTEQ